MNSRVLKSLANEVIEPFGLFLRNCEECVGRILIRVVFRKSCDGQI
jgi:hypothetical protein